ncbi:MAG: general secretion pathway protein GspE [Myxococcota bacterium]|nr:general secretion pathway protein GspE [Myxococcota bacterium]
MRLGELLLKEKVVTREGLDEALESQVVNGGRLGTNLCELGLIQEKDLARLLGNLHNCAFASGEMQPDPRAMELLDGQFLDDKDMLPMRVDPTRISVAVINPHDYASLDAIAFRTGRRAVPVIIPEFRMNQLLRRHCKAFRNIRPIDLNTIVPSKTLKTKQDGPKPMEAEELINEEEFQKLYAQAMVGGPAEAEAEVELLAEVVTEPAPRPVQPIPTGTQPGVQRPPPVQSGPRPAPPITVPPPVAASPFAAPVLAVVPNLGVAAPVAAPPPEPPPTPLTFPEAQKELGQVSSREDVARTVLRFGLGKWKRALLLSVQGDLVTGWHGMGHGVRSKAVQRIGISIRGGNGTFRLVRDTRSHYIGPMKRDAGTAVFYKLLGGDFPTTAVLLPLLVRGKVVHILYVDNGPGKITPPDIGELLILSQSVARSYEAMISRRKSA